MNTITLKELEAQYTGIYSVKANTARGRIEKSFYNLVVGDKVCINNHFVLIVEDQEVETETVEGENMEELRNELLDLFKGMDDGEIISAWNEYCAEYHTDGEIFDADQLEDLISSGDTLGWLNRFYFGSDDMGGENSSANPNRNYFCFNGYGNIVSFDYIYNQYSDTFYHMDIDALIDFIVENENALYNDDIQELLDNYLVTE